MLRTTHVTHRASLVTRFGMRHAIEGDGVLPACMKARPVSRTDYRLNNLLGMKYMSSKFRTVVGAG